MAKILLADGEPLRPESIVHTPRAAGHDPTQVPDGESHVPTVEECGRMALTSEQASNLHYLLATLDGYGEVQLANNLIPVRVQRQEVIRRLVGAIVTDCRSVEALLGCALALRTIRRSPLGSFPGTCEKLAQMLRETLALPKGLDVRVVAAISELKVRGRECRKVREGRLAGTLGVDPAHLAHLIRRDTRFRFVEWSWGVRILVAVPALISGRDPIKTVAYESGFAGTSHFDRCFRRLLGMCPSTFRTVARDSQNGPR
jgi:AraC-like DNA-binding protein